MKKQGILKLIEVDSDKGLNTFATDKSWVKPIIICDNKLTKGTIVACYEDENFTNFVGISIVEEDLDDNVAWCYDTIYSKLNYQFYCKKVLVLPEQFSPEFIKLIIDGKVKDGDNVDVQVTGYFPFDTTTRGSSPDFKVEDLIPQKRLHLNDNGFAVITLYNESVEEAANKFRQHESIIKHPDPHTNVFESGLYQGFIAGAKWQSEQSKVYTEDEIREMINMLLRFRNHCKIHGFPSKSFEHKINKWWNKNKK